MKVKTKTLLLCSVTFSCYVTPALAEPVTIGTLVANFVGSLLVATPGAGAAALGATGVAIVGNVIIGGAGLALSLFSAGQGKRSTAPAIIDTSSTSSFFTTGKSGQWRCIGRAKLGGIIVFGNTQGFVRYRLMAKCKGPIDAVEAYFMGTKEIIVEPNGNVSTPPFFSQGQSQVNIQSKFGDGNETAWQELIVATNGVWTQNHRLRGVHQTLVQYISPGINTARHQKIFGSGFQDVSSVIRGELLYDPRVGINRWTDNGPVACLHILLDQFKFDPSWFDMAQIARTANKGDQLMVTRTGALEKRSRAWGAWEEGKVTRGDLLQQVFQSTGCELIYLEGGTKIGIELIEDNRTPDAVIYSSNITEIGQSSGPEGVERPNICKVLYYSAERDYEVTELSLVVDQTASPQVPLRWSVVQDEIDRVGRKEVTYTLNFCPSASQAQRIARRLFDLDRASSGTIKTDLTGLAAWGARCLEIVDPDFGTMKVIPSPPKMSDEMDSVSFSFKRLEPLTEWNPNIDEALPLSPIVDLSFSALVAQPPPLIAFTRVTRSVSGQVITRYSANPPPGNVAIIEASYRRITNTVPGPWLSMVPSSNSDFHIVTALGGNVGDQVEARVRHFNNDDDGSIYSVTFNGILAINTSPPAPGTIVALLSYEENFGYKATLSYEVSTSLHVAGLIKNSNRPGFSGVIDVDPGQKFSEVVILGELPEETTVNFEITIVASGGVPSTVAIASVTTPPDP